MIRFPCSVV
uniref:Uncharacterized protein n=1 Tax=Rhizophora mucronata TaxID=61149 RepID=A0A2P2PXC8_RHIMU